MSVSYAMQNSVTIDNLNTLCRICLNTCDDLTDIRFGINDKLTEITRLKVELNDKLPKSICFSCNTELDHLFKFVEKVRFSDSYLRTLFFNQENKQQELTNEYFEESKLKCLKRGPKKKLRKSKSNKKKMKGSIADDLYLIVVPEITNSKSNITSEILIKQLNCNNEDLDLLNICKTLIESVSQKPFNCNHTTNVLINGRSDNLNSNKNETFKNVEEVCENSDSFQCSECRIFFPQFQDLITHSVSIHNNLEINKSNFKNQVENEKIKINKIDSKEKTFTDKKLEIINSMSTKQVHKKVFLINLNEFTCDLCLKKIKSKSLITEHMQLCHSNLKKQKNYFKKYVCPICKSAFIDSEKDFTEHLFFHKKENIDFIKVNSLGEPLNEEDGGPSSTFISYNDALIFFEVYKNPNKVFKIYNINSCDKCDYVSESHDFLINHYNIVHSENLFQNSTLFCPACPEKFYENNLDNNKLKFYEHLKCHKKEGISFVEINRNGSILEEFSEIFTQSELLLYLANDCLIFNPYEIWNPKVEFQDLKTNQVSYTCDLCQKVFSKKKLILKHLKSHRTKKVKCDLVCEKCGKKFSGKVNYQKHFLKHLNVLKSVGSRQVCTICKKNFANRASLNGHMKHHFKEGNGNEINSSLFGIICEKCGKSFSNNSSLTKHKKIHVAGKENAILKCEICNKNFLQQSSFDKHKSAHLNPKYLDCEVCKLPFPSVLSLQKHSALHKSGTDTHDCKSCKLSFLTKESLSAHQIHVGHYQDREPLECNVCHEKFFIGKKFSEHIKTHPKYKMGLCTLCGKRLSTPQSLMLHMDRHFESNSILCPHCGKQFFEERNYRRHLLSHEGIKPFSCDVKECEKSFYTLFELNRHKKYHYNKRDFACPYCSKCFHEANHLTIHVRTHTGERPYTCPHCSKGFITRTSCKQHIKLVHRGIGYDMIVTNISKKVAVFDAI